jgi:hypothetical protein
MNDDRTRELLRALPRTNVSPSFTARVLARLDEPQQRHPARWPRLAVGATALTLAVVLVGAGAWRFERERSAARARAELELLRAEQQALAADLANLREATSTDLYLGGNDNVDLVFDVSRGRRPAGVQPVSLRNAD